MLRDDSVEVNPALMSRLMLRFANDVDFITSTRAPIDPLEVVRTDGSGYASIRMDAEGLAPVIELAALKRGFLSRQVEVPGAGSDFAPVEIVLKGDSSIPDPDLLQLDELRAPLYADGFPDESTEASATAASASMRGLVSLAESLERRGQKDKAAIVFFEVANAPAVTASGYARGFDEQNPSSVAALEHALSLGKGGGYLGYLALTRKLDRAPELAHRALSADELRPYVDGVAAYIRENPDRAWPQAYHSLWLLYDQLGEIDAACATLDRLQAYEPAYLTRVEWVEYRASTGQLSGSGSVHGCASKPAAK
jgi:hypothetical protein